MPISPSLTRFLLIAAVSVFIGLLAVSCAQEEAPTLRVGGIPDQDAQRLARRYEIFADYLSKELDVPVEYVPSVSYSAVVTAFSQNDVQLAFFGALTGCRRGCRTPAPAPSSSEPTTPSSTPSTSCAEATSSPT